MDGFPATPRPGDRSVLEEEEERELELTESHRKISNRIAAAHFSELSGASNLEQRLLDAQATMAAEVRSLPAVHAHL